RLQAAAGVAHGGRHPGDLVAVGLAPAGPCRVDVPGPVARAGELRPLAADRRALEVVGGLDEALVGAELEAEGLRRRTGSLLRALERGGEDETQVVPVAVEDLGHPPRHLLPAVGQAETFEPAVEDAAGVVDLAV